MKTLITIILVLLSITTVEAGSYPANIEAMESAEAQYIAEQFNKSMNGVGNLGVRPCI